MTKFLSVFVITTLLFSAFADVKIDKHGRLKVMFYNAHNLFDAEHDQDRDDWTFLPANFPGKKDACEKVGNPYYKKQCLETDWTDQKVQWKLERFAEAINLVSPKLPDMLGLCEVENEKVVKRLAKMLGYDKVLITKGLDKRGIDNALMVRESRNLQVLDFKDDIEVISDDVKRPTRNILRVTVQVGGKHLLDLYVNHWPSQGNPSPARIAAAKTLMNNVRLMGKVAVPSLAMGDFNTIKGDFPHPFHTVLFQGPQAFTDVYDLFMQNKNVDKAIKNAQPLGTYFYARKMEWNRLDTFFANQGLLSGNGLKVDTKTFRILTHPKITRDFVYLDERDKGKPHFGSKVVGTPWGYNYSASVKEEAGYSDHFPVAVELAW